LEGEDHDAINEKAQALSEAAMKIGEAVYKAQQAESEAAAAQDANEDGAKVVDADFEDVTEPKGEDDGEPKAS
jgi:molecular chaperone DnaK